MTKYLVVFILLFVPALMNGQSTVVFQPDGKTGKDAALFSCVSCGSQQRNFGNSTGTYAISWTKEGEEYAVRSLIQFNLEEIPVGSVIQSATLSFYSASGSPEGSHFGFFGTNGAVLEKVLSPWDENSVTWSNQPKTSAKTRVPISGSIGVKQNFTHIDVKAFIQEMVNDPVLNYGFMLKLQSEQGYKKMVFASSDHPNPTVRPKLVVVYDAPDYTQQAGKSVSVLSEGEMLKIFPNPAKDALNIAINSVSGDPALVSIFDLKGREMMDQSFPLTEGKNQLRIETTAWPRGFYMILVKTGGEMITERLLLE